MGPKTTKVDDTKEENTKTINFPYKDLSNEQIHLIIPKLCDSPLSISTQLQAAKNHLIGNFYLKQRYFSLELLQM